MFILHAALRAMMKLTSRLRYDPEDILVRALRETYHVGRKWSLKAFHLSTESGQGRYVVLYTDAGDWVAPKDQPARIPHFVAYVFHAQAECLDYFEASRRLLHNYPMRPGIEAPTAKHSKVEGSYVRMWWAPPSTISLYPSGLLDSVFPRLTLLEDDPDPSF